MKILCKLGLHRWKDRMVPLDKPRPALFPLILPFGVEFRFLGAFPYT
jgi:hypothetical protein